MLMQFLKIGMLHISSKNCLDKSLYDMLALSCSNDKNACVASNSCMNINVEETQLIVEQDLNLSSSKTNYSSSSITHCLMAKYSSSNNNNNDDNDDDNNDEEDDVEKVNAMLQNNGRIIRPLF